MKVTIKDRIVAHRSAPDVYDPPSFEQMADRIEELEAELAEYKHVASAIDTQWAESQDEIADLKDKLAKAVDFIEDLTGCEWPYDEDAKRILAELTGGEDE